MSQEQQALSQLLSTRRDDVLREWLAEAAAGAGTGAASPADAASLLDAFQGAVRAGQDLGRFDDPRWQPVRDALSQISMTRAAQGASAGDTSRFILAFKKPLFTGLSGSLSDPRELLDAVWRTTSLVDSMAQFTVTNHQHAREQVIARQQEELLELSTPVVKLWDGVLAVPMIGTLDSSRTQLVMESLLQRIVETGSEIAIIDITGVPTVDTLVAQHLLKTVTAIRLMGAECIISGVRPQIAQTIVHLGIDLQGITTKASLADALSLAMKRAGYVVSRPAA
jgi:rsbT co-antagonist protein RsbR